MSQPDENAVIFLQALREILPYLQKQDDVRLAKRIGKEKLQDACDDLAGYIAAGVSGELNQNEKLALSVQLLKCLSRYMKTGDIPLTLNTMVNSMSLLHHSIEQSFPGYTESKLLRYTISPITLKRA